MSIDRLLAILALRPVPPPARVHYLEPLHLSTARITVHKDGSQQHAPLGKAFPANGASLKSPLVMEYAFSDLSSNGWMESLEFGLRSMRD